MRVVLVGSERARRRLRGQLADDMEIVGETSTVEAARTARFDADAWIVVPEATPGPARDGDVPVEALTAREREVLELLAEGLSNRAIGAELEISDQTVKFHVASICAKLGAVNRTDAVRRALRLGLLAL
jgi:ATP/maltotriose-dependent transcriptional regulator MalT